MIWMRSEELLDAVHRSLLENIAPAVTDPYAKVQVVAAAHALVELRQRIVDGDPVVRDTAALETLLDSWGESRPAADDEDDPRAVNRLAREAVVRAVTGQDEERAGERAAEVAQVESALAKEDLRWVCREAMATLE
ncbi:hypothetical protein [Streptomyces sp. NPDC047453]|uniref:hypothetical protein n=1 Tax=Streptomyces sp. NPDC047453 TaxID=3154812 RepID=UPI0033E80378